MIRKSFRVWAVASLVTISTLLAPGAPVVAEPGAEQAPAAPAYVRCDTSLHRIRFAPGAYGATVNGTLSTVCPSKWYVLRALRGQRMRVQIIGRGPTAGVVYFPGGGQDGGPGGVIFDGTLPRTGDYRIKAMESTMGNRWNGSFSLIVTIY